jgi:hypothetical protein
MTAAAGVELSLTSCVIGHPMIIVVTNFRPTEVSGGRYAPIDYL